MRKRTVVLKNNKERESIAVSESYYFLGHKDCLFLTEYTKKKKNKYNYPNFCLPVFSIAALFNVIHQNTFSANSLLLRNKQSSSLSSETKAAWLKGFALHSKIKLIL